MGDPIDDVLARRGGIPQDAGALASTARPRLRLAVVTCMDARIDVFRILGLTDGDAHILRNAGGIVTSDVIRSLVISQHLLGTDSVMLIHHTRCGLEGLDRERLRATVERDGHVLPFDLGTFANVETDVRDSIRRVQESPFLPHRDRVRGFVYDVVSRELSEVAR